MKSFAIAAAAIAWLAVGPISQAISAIGYEPSNDTPIVVGNSGNDPQIVASLAVDQGNQRLYIGIATTDINTGEPGLIQQRESDHTPTPSSPFTTGLNNSYYSGVAVDPTNHNLYVSQARATIPSGTFGEHRLRVFSATGTQLATWATTNTTANPPMIATDSTGRVFYPNDSLNSVQIFNSSGTLLSSITCGSCDGGAFASPRAIAIDSDDNAYVVDIGTQRVVKFTPSGGGYVYSSVLQTGREARAVAIEPSTDDVFVVGRDGELGYHVTAYTSAGVEFDDFAGGNIAPPPPSFAELGALPLAVNATNHKLYIGDGGNFQVITYNRVTSKLPTVAAVAAAPVGQLTATIKASVNPEGHAIIDCEFEYTDDADYQANGFANSTLAPCSSEPEGTKATTISSELGSLAPDTVYRYRVIAQSHAGISTGSAQTFETLPVTMPTVSTSSAQKVVQAGALLVGKVNPKGGLSSSCYFEYGTTVSYGKQAPCAALPLPDSTETQLQVPISSLTPGTSYHFRLVLTTNAGTQTGSDEAFTTLSFLAPTVTGLSAAGITETGATIAGSINPNGATATCFFEYGTTTSYGSTAPCPVEPGGGSGVVVQELAFTGLTPGTTYHYRLVGASKAGTAQSNDVAFTTQSPPPPPQPPTQQPPVTKPPVKPLVCKKGFKKKKVRGKMRCVKKKKAKKRRK